ncbi:MAG: ATPase domain-containing protein [Candidatus Bathyarchaeota archaeon]
MRNDRVETGITHLDAALQGGLPRGSLTLVAGNPGTGKTILCGEFLHKGASCGESCLYVSLSEGRDSFLEYMGRLGRDFTDPQTRSHLDILDLVSVKEEGLDILMEMIITRVDTQRVQRLVVDSFTALSNALTASIDARVTLHILSKILGQATCTTLLVTEVPTGTSRLGMGVEEFVADGIISLRRRVVNGSTLRELEITKMRGTLVERPLHLFTLHGGFNALPPFQPAEISQPRPYTPRPDREDTYSTGNQQLDTLTGGLRRGDTVYVDMGDSVPPMVPALLVGPLRSNFLAQGRGVLFMPPGGENLDRIHRFDQQFALGPRAAKLVRIATAPNNQGGRPPELALDPRDPDAALRAWADSEEELSRETGGPLLKIIYVDSLRTCLPHADHRRFLDHQSMRARDAGGLLVLLSRPGDDHLRQHAGNLAHTHLQVTNHEGVMLLQGVKPRTPLHAVAQDPAQGHPSLSLTPIY